jgi:hypothetical protein
MQPEKEGRTMKKPLTIAAILTVLLAFTLTQSGFAQSQPNPTKLQKDGMLRVIWSNGPRVLGYLPEMAPGDEWIREH